MSEVHAQFSAGMDTRQYESSVVRMGSTMSRTATTIMADMAATQKATERMTSGVNKSERSMYRLGQTAMQIQDVAVQLEGGASAARVFAQQGSQLASFFGPTGMIIGGVIAIGGGIASWAMGIEKANQKAKDLMTSLGSVQDQNDKLRAQAQADAAKVREIREADAGGEENPFILKARQARELKAMDDERAKQSPAMQIETFDQFNKARAAMEQRHEAELESMYQKNADKRAEIDRKRLEETAQDYRKIEAEQMRDFEKHTREKAETEKKWRSEFDKTVQAAEKNTENREQRREREDQIAEKQRELSRAEANQRLATDAASGEQIAKTPGQERAERKAEREQLQRDRTEAKREADRQDREARKAGTSGLTKKEREDIEREAMDDQRKARNKEKLTAEVSDENIAKLKKEIADGIKELIPK